MARLTSNYGHTELRSGASPSCCTASLKVASLFSFACEVGRGRQKRAKLAETRPELEPMVPVYFCENPVRTQYTLDQF